LKLKFYFCLDVSNQPFNGFTGTLPLNQQFEPSKITLQGPQPQIDASRSIQVLPDFQRGHQTMFAPKPLPSGSINERYIVDDLIVDDKLLALQGPYFTLSNYYVSPIFVKNKRYRLLLSIC